MALCFLYKLLFSRSPQSCSNPVLGYDIPTPAVYGFGYKLEENFCSMDADISCFLKDA